MFPTGVSITWLPVETRPMNSRVLMSPMVPCMHPFKTPELLKKITPATDLGSVGLQSKAPTIASNPLGSLNKAVLNQCAFSSNRSLSSAILPTPRSGPPSTTTLVGSPAVCESMTLILLTSLGITLFFNSFGAASPAHTNIKLIHIF